MLPIVSVIIIPGTRSSLRARDCLEIEINEHSATLGVTCLLHVDLPAIVGFMDWYYRYKEKFSAIVWGGVNPTYLGIS